MPIIDKIKEAENMALNIKKEATEEVNIMIDEVNKNNNFIIKELIENNNLQIKKLYEENELSIEKLTDASNKEIEAINLKNSELVKNHLSETTSFILKKVIDS